MRNSSQFPPKVVTVLLQILLFRDVNCSPPSKYLINLAFCMWSNKSSPRPPFFRRFSMFRSNHLTQFPFLCDMWALSALVLKRLLVFRRFLFILIFFITFQKLDEDDDDGYLDSSWADGSNLKRQVHGVDNVKFRCGMWTLSSR